MNSQDLDELIDAAARDMALREPGRSLGHDVMARVRGRVEPAPWRVGWIVSATAALICAVIVVTMWNRVPAPAREPQAPPTATAEVRVAVPPAVNPRAVAPESSAAETREPVRRSLAFAAEAAILEAPLMSSLEPLTTDPIVLLPLDVPPLETGPATIQDIDIGDITIEPLAASND